MADSDSLAGFFLRHAFLRSKMAALWAARYRLPSALTLSLLFDFHSRK
jgi:hypothetical protein